MVTPVIINGLDKRGFFRKYPKSIAPLQVIICGILLTFATPMACALFSQKVEVKISKLEKQIQVSITSILI